MVVSSGHPNMIRVKSGKFRRNVRLDLYLDDFFYFLGVAFGRG